MTSIQKTRKTIRNDSLFFLQTIHACLITIVPLIGTVIAIFMLDKFRIGSIEIGSLVTMWLLSGAGITVGYHRLFTHRSFRTYKVIQVALVILGSMAGQGPLVYWVSLHRRHHECSDQLGDPHSPNLRGEGILNRLEGLGFAHVGWMFRHEVPNSIYYAPELLKDTLISKVSKFYFLWLFLGILLPTLACGLLTQAWFGSLYGFLWGGLVRLFVVENAIWSVNSITHLYGSRPFNTREHSTNNFLLCIPTLGESWHNNHHAFNSSAFFGLEWWQVDIGGWIIQLLDSLGLAWDVKSPSQRMISSQKNILMSEENS